MASPIDLAVRDGAAQQRLVVVEIHGRSAEARIAARDDLRDSPEPHHAAVGLGEAVQARPEVQQVQDGSPGRHPVRRCPPPLLSVGFFAGSSGRAFEERAASRSPPPTPRTSNANGAGGTNSNRNALSAAANADAGQSPCTPVCVDIGYTTDLSEVGASTSASLCRWPTLEVEPASHTPR